LSGPKLDHACSDLKNVTAAAVRCSGGAASIALSSALAQIAPWAYAPTWRTCSALRELAGVSAADPVTGPYDIIVTIETPDSRDIGRLVMNEIHGVAGIKRTVTCLAI
jgi:DNA-binding Lrp family transcriptional regulator